MTTQEEKIRVNARIPKDLYDYVIQEYDNMSQAINRGLENLRESKSSEMSYIADNVIQDSHTSPDNVIQEHTPVIQDSHTVYDNVIHPDIQVLTARTEEQNTRIEEYKAQVRTLNTEIERLKTVIMEAPDPLELTELKSKQEIMQMLLQEKDSRIQDLSREVDRLDMFAHYFKNTEVKQLEAPAVEKKKPWFKFW